MIIFFMQEAKLVAVHRTAMAMIPARKTKSMIPPAPKMNSLVSLPHSEASCKTSRPINVPRLAVAYEIAEACNKSFSPARI